MKKLILLTIIMLFTLPVFANIGNILWTTQPLKKKEKDDKKWFYTLDFSFKNQTGNIDAIGISGSTSIMYFNGIFTYKTSFNFSYSKEKSDGSEIHSNEGFGKVNLDYLLHKRFELFFFSFNKYSEMEQLVYRNNTGIGPKLIIFNNPYLLMDISYAPTYQYEDYKTRNVVNTFVHSFRYRIDIFFFKVIKYQFFCYYIPLYDFSEYRFILETSLSFDFLDLKWTKKSGIGFKIGFRREYTSNPPVNVNSTDSIVDVSLRLFL